MQEEIRRPSTEQLASVHEIWAACWDGPLTTPATKEMPHFAPRERQDVSMLFEGGEPVSCVVYGRRELMVGPARLRLGAIGDVATKIPYQRRGYASRLLIESVRRMADRGDHVSILFTFSYEYYRRFGWEIGGDSWELLLFPAEFGQEEFALPAYEGTHSVRPFRESDVSGMAPLHRTNLSRRGWGLVRPEAYWPWAAEWLNESNCSVCVGPRGVEGYLVAETTPRLQRPDEFTFRRTDDPLWPVDVGPVLHVVELVAGTPAARRAFVGHLALQAAEIGALAFPFACHSDLQAAGLLVPPARLRLMPSFMFRVVSVPDAIDALKDVRPPDEPFSLAVSDPAGINADPVAIGPRANGLDVVRGRTEKHHLSMGIQAFSQVFAGYRTASDLWSLGSMNASSARAVALADQVFISREPFIGEFDLF